MIAERAVNHCLLNTPYGGHLVDLLVQAEELDELRSYASQLPSLQIFERSVCDLELLACGAFSPLDRFVGKEEHQRILDEMRLLSGHIFPIPVPLPVNPCPELHLDREFALRGVKNELLAILNVEEIYEWDKAEVAQKVFGTQDPKHPLVAEMQHWGKLNVSGTLRVLQLPRYYNFQDLRLTPAHSVGAVQIDLTPTSGNGFSRANAFAYLPTVFTDNTIMVGKTTAKAQHIIELRQAVDAMRAVAGLGGAPWTDPSLPAGNTIRAIHILDLRTFLHDAATRLGYSTSAYTDLGLTSGFVIKRIHIEELRQRIRTIAG